MAVQLSNRSYNYAKQLIDEGKVVLDERDDWSEHQPSTRAENEFIETHGIDEYAKWHLGVEDTANPNTKGAYKYPYGDFSDVHRCAVLSAESRAGRNHHTEIQKAVAHINGMLEAKQ
jgi:hypothetical protein